MLSTIFQRKESALFKISMGVITATTATLPTVTDELSTTHETFSEPVFESSTSSYTLLDSMQ
jgi:hypothetical protein